MSEPLFRPTAPSLRTVSYALLSVLLACACQSSSAEPAAAVVAPSATADAITSALPTAAVTSAAAPNASNEEKEPEATEKVDAKPTSAKPVSNTKPATEAKSAKTDEPAKPVAEPVKQPEATPAIDKPCLAKSFNFASVRTACEKGGVPKAKALMKAWTNKAKDKGETYKCATCHDNQKTYSNKPTADADLRKLLDLIK